MKKHINIRSKAVPLIFQIIIIGFWQIVVDKGNVERYILPSPKDIILMFFEILPDIKMHIYVTLKEAVIGFLISVLFAVVLALLMDNIKIIKKSVYPILVISQTIPTVVLAPLFGMWFGFGMLPKIIIVVLVCFFPIVISLMDGLNSVDEDMINLLKSMGASKIQIFKIVKFPASIVNFFSGLRIAATYSVMGAVIGEWVGSNEGLGFYMMRVKHSFAMDKVFAVVLVIIILSVILFSILFLIQYILTPWSRKK